MKKLSFLAGTIGSTAAWYILSNKKLRTELGRAKNAEETIAVLKRYIGKDADKIGQAVHDWVRSEEVQGGLSKAKEMTQSATKGLKGFFGKAAKALESATQGAKDTDAA